MKANILIVDDQPEVCQLLTDFLRERQYATTAVATPQQALRRVESQPEGFQLVILDLDFGPGQMNGLEALRQLKQAHPTLPVIILSGKATVHDAVQALKWGAADFLEKDPYLEDNLAISMEKMRSLLHIIEENKRLAARNLSLQRETDFYREQVQKRYNIVGESPSIREVLRQVVKVAQVPRPVLIRGERGTGKELVAAAIHQASPRAGAPFITINCAALSEGLLECELFGQEANAFHNAPFKLGRFELAHQGTLFLDEIGNMSLEFQRKILRVIEYQQFERVQGTETLTVDVRVVAATNTCLEEAMKEGRFREDLYDRLAFETLFLPPLRERKEDIPLLAEHFLRLFAAEVPGITVKRISPEALAILQGYHWPGNVRELKNVIERAAYRVEGEVIRPTDLPLDLRSRSEPVGDGFLEKVEHFERTLLLEALEATHWNQKEAAARLGLKYDQLRHLYKKYRLSQQKL